MPKVDGLTQKEIKLIRGILEGKTKQQAALEAYNASTPATASSMASETLKKPNVQEALQLALSKQGIDIDVVVAPVAKALKHEDLDMQLKGHDRAMKILNVNQAKEGGDTYNFTQVNNDMRGKYAD